MIMMYIGLIFKCIMILLHYQIWCGVDNAYITIAYTMEITGNKELLTGLVYVSILPTNVIRYCILQCSLEHRLLSNEDIWSQCSQPSPCGIWERRPSGSVLESKLDPCVCNQHIPITFLSLWTVTEKINHAVNIVSQKATSSVIFFQKRLGYDYLIISHGNIHSLHSYEII